MTGQLLAHAASSGVHEFFFLRRMFVVMILGALVFGKLLSVVYKRLPSSGGRVSKRDKRSAEDILMDRYSRGQLSGAEYQAAMAEVARMRGDGTQPEHGTA